ncbi:MAG: hypothetical protein K1Y36_29780, partial [Blastocatellia bacterium]|nr:hypothetical protein [Blastocatellia bacterium]
DLQELPEGSLSLSDFEVQFQRPKTNRRIFLDIAVPTGMSVLVYINNQQVLTGPIQEPIAIFKGQKVQGSKNASATFVRAICTGTDSSFPTFPARN